MVIICSDLHILGTHVARLLMNENSYENAETWTNVLHVP